MSSCFHYQIGGKYCYMKLTGILGTIALVLPLLGAAYGGITYINKLQNTLNQNTEVLRSLQNEMGDAFTELNNVELDVKGHIQNEIEKLEMAVKNVEALYAQGREDLVIEISNLNTFIAGVDKAVRLMENSQYKLATEAELRALQDSYYKLSDDINQFKYDIKELERKLDGGY